MEIIFGWISISFGYVVFRKVFLVIDLEIKLGKYVLNLFGYSYRVNVFMVIVIFKNILFLLMLL